MNGINPLIISYCLTLSITNASHFFLECTLHSLLLSIENRNGIQAVSFLFSPWTTGGLLYLNTLNIICLGNSSVGNWVRCYMCPPLSTVWHYHCPLSSVIGSDRLESGTLPNAPSRWQSSPPASASAAISLQLSGQATRTLIPYTHIHRWTFPLSLDRWIWSSRKRGRGFFDTFDTSNQCRQNPILKITGSSMRAGTQLHKW